MRRVVLALAGALLPALGLAQTDPMAQQRCVWACLANFGPNTNPAYHACVAERCEALGDASDAAAAPPADPTAAWVAGRLGDGTGYAGIDAVRGVSGLYYFCRRGGTSFLRLVGAGKDAAPLRIDVDGALFDLAPRPGARGTLEADIPPAGALLQALQRGSRARLLSGAGAEIFAVPLAGSRGALSGVISSC